MNHVGRKVIRGPEFFTVQDYYAEDVRRVLRDCKAPDNWGDETAFFLLELVINPKLDHKRGFKGSPQLQLPVLDTILRLRESSSGKLWHILNQIDVAIKKRSLRKEQPSMVWQIVTDQAALSSQLAERYFQTTVLPDNPIFAQEYQVSKERIDRFWENKAEFVACDYYQRLKENFSAKHVENARADIRRIRPFKRENHTPERIAYEANLREIINQQVINVEKWISENMSNATDNNKKEMQRGIAGFAIGLKRAFDVFAVTKSGGKYNPQWDKVIDQLFSKNWSPLPDSDQFGQLFQKPPQ